MKAFEHRCFAHHRPDCSWCLMRGHREQREQLSDPRLDARTATTVAQSVGWWPSQAAELRRAKSTAASQRYRAKKGSRRTGEWEALPEQHKKAIGLYMLRLLEAGRALDVDENLAGYVIEQKWGRRFGRDWQITDEGREALAVAGRAELRPHREPPPYPEG